MAEGIPSTTWKGEQLEETGKRAKERDAAGVKKEKGSLGERIPNQQKTFENLKLLKKKKNNNNSNE